MLVQRGLLNGERERWKLGIGRRLWIVYLVKDLVQSKHAYPG